VWIVAAGYAAVQLLVCSLGRAPSWDEAIYLSQVSRGTPALPFVASRARGITLLVAPLTSIGTPLWLVRLCLVAASALALALVFRVWVPVVGGGAPAGAVVFAVSWPALLYGSEVMPNLWAAFTMIACVGFAARTVAARTVAARTVAEETGGDGAGSSNRRDLIGVTVAAALGALVRPSDALVVAVGITVAALWVGPHVRPTAWRAAAVAGAGTVVGALPWFVEMSARFGGPLEAVRRARELSHLGGGIGLRANLALTDGPLLGPDPSGGVPWFGVLWWVGLAALIGVAWTKVDGTGARDGIRMATITGAILAATYIVLIGGLAPRFLLPALGLLSLAAGCGVVRLRPRARAGRIGVAAVAVGLVLWAPWQIVTADRLEGEAVADRSIPRAAGEAVDRVIDDEPCLVVSDRDYPQVALAAGCLGRAGSEAPPPASADAPAAVIVVTSVPPDPSRASIDRLPDGWFATRW
jgi:hypothetical protein